MNESTKDSDPFARLVHTHGRIELRLADLEGAADDLSVAERRGAALETIADVLHFFSRAGARHNDDEEQTLFPRLRQISAFTQMLDAFEVQHQMTNATLAELAAVTRGFTPGAEAKVRAIAMRFAEMYRAHILAEERALFPAAAKALAPDVIAQMGVEMSERRPDRGRHH